MLRPPQQSCSTCKLHKGLAHLTAQQNDVREPWCSGDALPQTLRIDVGCLLSRVKLLGLKLRTARWGQHAHGAVPVQSMRRSHHGTAATWWTHDNLAGGSAAPPALHAAAGNEHVIVRHRDAKQVRDRPEHICIGIGLFEDHHSPLAQCIVWHGCGIRDKTLGHSVRDAAELLCGGFHHSKCDDTLLQSR